MYGEGLRFVGRQTEERVALGRALRLAQSNPKAVAQISLALAAFYEADHNYAKVEALYRRITEVQRRMPGWFWLLRGANFARWGKFSETEKYHRRATRMKSADREEAYLNIGYVLRAQFKYKQAKKAFQKALEIDPNYSEAKRAISSLQGVEAVTSK